MPKDEYRIKQGPIRRDSDEIGVRSRLIAVHQLIEDRLHRRRWGSSDEWRDSQAADRHREEFTADDRQLDERTSQMREALTAHSARHEVVLHSTESKRRRWDRIAVGLLIFAALAFAAALWMRFGDTPIPVD